jgi:hypothetical protein
MTMLDLIDVSRRSDRCSADLGANGWSPIHGYTCVSHIHPESRTQILFALHFAVIPCDFLESQQRLRLFPLNTYEFYRVLGDFTRYMTPEQYREFAAWALTGDPEERINSAMSCIALGPKLWSSAHGTSFDLVLKLARREVA